MTLQYKTLALAPPPYIAPPEYKPVSDFARDLVSYLSSHSQSFPAHRFGHLLKWFNEYCQAVDQPVYRRPLLLRSGAVSSDIGGAAERPQLQRGNAIGLTDAEVPV